MWMFSMERNALQLSHPRQRESYPGQAGPSDPSPVLPKTPFSLPLIYTAFPKGLLADTLDATPPGRSSQILTKIWPPSRMLAPCGT